MFNFTARKEFKELKDEIEKAGIPAIRITAGRYGGTFVVKELVYAYAMWIFPAFHLKVIRAYDTLQQTQGVAVAYGAMIEDILAGPSSWSNPGKPVCAGLSSA